MFFRLTPIVKLLLIINVAVFIIEMLAGSLTIDSLPFKMWFMRWFALMPIEGLPVGYNIVFDFYPWQLITYQFMHGDFWHIFMNMFMLWMFGTELEQNWGSKKFILFYLICGIGAGLSHMLMSLFLGHIAPAIGASGSIYGLFFGFIMLNPDRRMMIFPLFIPIKAKWIGIGMVAISLIGGLSGGDGIAHFAHLGGGLMGFLLVKLLPNRFGLHNNEYGYGYIPPKNKSFIRNIFGNSSKAYKKEKPQSYSINWEEPKRTTSQSSTTSTTSTSYNLKEIYVSGQKISQEMIDNIIDKISKSGYASLTEQEKYILTEVSKQI